MKDNDTLEEVAEKIRVCQLCSLHRSRSQAVPGEGSYEARIMFIGEAPGSEEDRLGRPFVGRAGRLLDEALSQAELKREEVFIANIVKCRPPGNRPPSKDEREICAVYLNRQIELISPEVICLLGNTAVQTLLNRRSVRNVRAKLIMKNGRRYFATYHPAAALYDTALKPLLFKDISRLRSLVTESRIKSSSSGRRTTLDEYL